MTYNVQTYEFTAFTEADLLDAGADGHSVNCGDTFTMPANATVCFSVTDNDGGLSGDCRDNATDHYGQHAQIADAATGLEIGNGGQIYAEKYWVLHGSDGKTYYLIEIEQENGDAPGAGDDYFTFYGEVPPAGVELTVTSSCNIKGDWLSYRKLDAGVKFEPDTDGKISVEAEDLELCGYKVEHQDAASGDELIKLKCNTGYAKLPSFGGESCVYDIQITLIDENDGEGFLDIFIDGEFAGCFRLDQNDGGNGYHVDGSSFSTVTLHGVEIPKGAEITFKGRKDDGEYIRLDKIEFCKVEFRECDDPDAVNIGFDGFVAGDKITDQIDGLTITAIGGSGDAMIFDSQNPTGGDGDLETQVTQLGNLLIVSEDGDMSDPDDAVGGTICIEFDNPARVFDLKVIDTEEGGTITAELEDGSTVDIEIPKIANGGVAQVLIDLEGVTKLTIALDGSGAIDDLCYVPGEPQLGSLSGRYFCDENGDGLDNDGTDNGVGGIEVELLDAAGNALGVFTTTDSAGLYSFGDLEPGIYGVRFFDEAGATVGKSLVAPNANNNQNDDIDSDAVGNNQLSEILGIEVVGGQDTPDNDAGVVPLGSVAGRLFCDTDNDDLDNGNGTEPGVAGVTVTLTNVTTGEEMTTKTDSEGDYIFDNLAAGEYKVTFDGADPELDGKVFVNRTPGDNDAIGGSDVDPANGMTEVFTLGVDEDKTDVDAGVEDDDPRTGAIGDTVWLDSFGDGILNDGSLDPFFSGAEEGVSGVTVQLKDAASSTVLAEQITDENGQYLFTGLAAGEYVIGFVLPDGFEFTAQDAGADDTRDSDADRSTGMTDVIVLAQGEVNLTVDAGLLRCGLIEGSSQADPNSPVGGYDLLIGCEGDDTILGFSGEDTLIGNGGDDRIDGSSFDDTLDGGAGNDDLNGGSENDILIGGAGDDDINGDGEFDIAVFSGNFADSTIEIADIFTGELTVTGADGVDRVRNVEVLRFDDGAVTVDSLLPGGSRDAVAAPVAGGSVNIDVLANDIELSEGALEVAEVNNGGFGTAVIEADGTVTYTSGADFAGYDFFTYTVSNGLGFLRTVEVQVGELPNLTAGDPGVIALADALGADGITFIGTTAAESILGGTGFDRIEARGGSDIVDGGKGNDRLIGGPGNDLLIGGEGDDVIQSDGNSDVAFGGIGDDNLGGQFGADFLFGGAGNDDIRGLQGSDFMSGGTGDDTFRLFRDGADIALGGAGADSFEWAESNGAERDLIDGESGIDSLEITLDAGADMVAVQAEIDAYLAQAAANTPSGGTISDGSVLSDTFSFTTIGLDIRNIEDVFIA